MAAIFFKGLGQLCGGLLLLLVVVQFSVVLGRYLFDVNFLWAQEGAVYLHCSIFMLAAAWSFWHDRHIRLDVFAAWFGEKGQKIINVLGMFFLLLPMMGLIVIVSFGYVAESWSVWEGSPELSGLPARYLLKSLILIFASLMIGAGVLRLICSVQDIRAGGK